MAIPKHDELMPFVLSELAKEYAVATISWKELGVPRKLVRLDEVVQNDREL